MKYLVDFARPKGSKDKVKRNRNRLRIIQGIIGAAIGGKSNYLITARNKKVWDKTYKGKVPYTMKNVLKKAIVPSLVGAGVFLTTNEINNKINENIISKNKNPLKRRKLLERLYDVS